MTKPRKKGKRTAHRRAVTADPKLQKRIKRLSRRWEHASAAELIAEVTSLFGKGCSIAGLANDIHQPPSTVRYYLKPALAAPNDVKAKPLPVRDPADNGSGKPPTSFVLPHAGSASSKGQFNGVAKAPLESGKPPQGKQSLTQILKKLPPRPVPAPPAEREETVASLKLRIPEIILHFIREKLTGLDSPARADKIHEFLAHLSTLMRADLPWKTKVQLPEKITLRRLFEITKPKQFPEKCDSNQLAAWLTIILTSLDRTSYDSDIGNAERQLLPAPEPTATPLFHKDEFGRIVDESGRPLKPYEIRLKQLAKRKREDQDVSKARWPSA